MIFELDKSSCVGCLLQKRKGSSQFFSEYLHAQSTSRTNSPVLQIPTTTFTLRFLPSHIITITGWQNYLLDDLNRHAVLHAATRVQELSLPQNLQPNGERYNSLPPNFTQNSNSLPPNFTRNNKAEVRVHARTVPRILWRRRDC